MKKPKNNKSRTERGTVHLAETVKRLEKRVAALERARKRDENWPEIIPMDDEARDRTKKARRTGTAREPTGSCNSNHRGRSRQFPDSLMTPLRSLASKPKRRDMALSLSLETQSNPSKDHQEAVWAFAQKRWPNFTGR